MDPKGTFPSGFRARITGLLLHVAYTADAKLQPESLAEGSLEPNQWSISSKFAGT